MRAEMHHGVRVEVFLQVAIESRERVGRRQAIFEQQPHRVALVTEGRLNADEDAAELAAEHVDIRAVGLLLARRRTPFLLDGIEPALATNVIVSGNLCMHIGLGAVDT